MADVEGNDKDLRNIYCRYKDNQSRVLFAALNEMPTCRGKHSALIAEVQNKMFWYKQMTYFCQILLAILMVMSIFTVIGIWYLYFFNNPNRFGDCLINFNVPFDDCPIAF